ncbi:MAG: Divalent-cation tolerance protein CutA [Chlamydiae bacterium]|nr:Divalent-cation tolerance protein CutA [Chlamydiota bacterium]
MSHKWPICVNKKGFVQIYWTCGSIGEAREIACYLVENHLVACANIIPNVESVYLWKEKLESGAEVKVIFKTREEKFEAVKETILQRCSYDVPEILQVPITDGHQPYLDWVASQMPKP